jgi:hypothetical protein
MISGGRGKMLESGNFRSSKKGVVVTYRRILACVLAISLTTTVSLRGEDDPGKKETFISQKYEVNVDDFSRMDHLTGSFFIETLADGEYERSLRGNEKFLLCMIDIETGKGKILLDENRFSGSLQEVALSPNKNKLAFFDSDEYLSILRLDDGLVEKRLDAAQGGGLYRRNTGRYIVWSPSGHKVAFVNNRDLYTIDEDGANLSRIVIHKSGNYGVTPFLGSITCDQIRRPVWKPDGHGIMYDDFPLPASTYGPNFISCENKAVYEVDIHNLESEKILEGYTIIEGCDKGIIGVLEHVSHKDKPDNPTLKLIDHHGAIVKDYGSLCEEYPDLMSASPDCRYLAFKQEGDLVILALDSIKRTVVDMPHSDYKISWSPDGDYLAVLLRPESRIDIVNPETGNMQKLFTMRGAYDIKWTAAEVVSADLPLPDICKEPLPMGKVIFTSGSGSRGVNCDILVRIIEDSDIQKLAANEYWEGWPITSAENNKIAFLASSEEKGDIELWLMDGNGDEKIKISHGVGVDAPPIWSPDGQMIAFAGHSIEENYHASRGIYVVNADGTDQKLLTKNIMYCLGSLSGNFSLFQYSWSPDSSSIAFGGDSVSVANVNTGIETCIVKGDGRWVSDPVWSQNGDRILFVKSGKTSDEIRIINSDGSNESVLMPGISGAFDSRIYNPQWSPDGSQIAFIVGIGPAIFSRKADNLMDWLSDIEYYLYVMDNTGSNRRRLANNVSTRFFWNSDSDWILSHYETSDSVFIANTKTGYIAILGRGSQPKWF